MQVDEVVIESVVYKIASKFKAVETKKKYKVKINNQVSDNVFDEEEAMNLAEKMNMFPGVKIELIEVGRMVNE